MSNTATTPANTKTRRATPATMRAALVRSGSHTKAEAAALAPKALVEAHAALANTPAPAPAPTAKETPMSKPAKTPAKAKKAPAKPAPATPAASKPAATPRNCGCGCGAPTITEKASFLPGHDARFAGLVGRGEITPADWQTALVTPALAKKIDGIRETAKKKQAVKAAREAAKAAAKAAFDAAMA